MTVTKTERTAKARRRGNNHDGFAERWESTPALARQFGLPVATTERQVRDGTLTPTFRTPSGQARWRRSDFASQVLPLRLQGVPTGIEQPNGTTVWRRLGFQVIAQPGRSVLVSSTGGELLLDPTAVRLLVAVLPEAATIADTAEPESAPLGTRRSS
jgi:hypothetical protein